MKQIVPLKHCEWNRSTNFLTLASEFFGGSFPKEVTVESHHTGVQATFLPVQPGDPKFDEDQWDGEMMLYKSTSGIRTPYLAVYHMT